MAIITTNSASKAVKFINNDVTILVFALQDGAFWFEIGEYTTLNGAKKAAQREMQKAGYICNVNELNALKSI